MIIGFFYLFGRGGNREGFKDQLKEGRLEDKRMFEGNLLQSLGAIIEKALSPMREEERRTQK